MISTNEIERLRNEITKSKTDLAILQERRKSLLEEFEHLGYSVEDFKTGEDINQVVSDVKKTISELSADAEKLYVQLKQGLEQIR